MLRLNLVLVECSFMLFELHSNVLIVVEIAALNIVDVQLK